MVKVKICGIRKKEDLELAENFGVDYIGFILFPKSPRYAGEKVKELLSLNTRAKKVVVFVNPSYEKVKKVLDYGADFVQLHGDETTEFAKKIGFFRVIKAFRIKETVNIKELLEKLSPWEKAYAVLLDTYKKGLPGGTGEPFNWGIAKRIVEKGFKIFLAGGLKPENIKSAIETVNPYAVDISSGVEKEPGKKDPEKLKTLFMKIKLLQQEKKA